MFVAFAVAAAALNAAGYLFNWFDEIRYYDEACHLFTPFAISGLAASRLLASVEAARRIGRLAFLVALTLLGLLVGIAWEAFEFAIGILGNTVDTALDLALDGLGALIGAALAWSRAIGSPGSER